MIIVTGFDTNATNFPPRPLNTLRSPLIGASIIPLITVENPSPIAPNEEVLIFSPVNPILNNELIKLSTMDDIPLNAPLNNLVIADIAYPSILAGLNILNAIPSALDIPPANVGANEDKPLPRVPNKPLRSPPPLRTPNTFPRPPRAVLRLIKASTRGVIFPAYSPIVSKNPKTFSLSKSSLSAKSATLVMIVSRNVPLILTLIPLKKLATASLAVCHPFLNPPMNFSKAYTASNICPTSPSSPRAQSFAYVSALSIKLPSAPRFERPSFTAPMRTPIFTSPLVKLSNGLSESRASIAFFISLQFIETILRAWEKLLFTLFTNAIVLVLIPPKSLFHIT